MYTARWTRKKLENTRKKRCMTGRKRELEILNMSPKKKKIWFLSPFAPPSTRNDNLQSFLEVLYKWHKQQRHWMCEFCCTIVTLHIFVVAFFLSQIVTTFSITIFNPHMLGMYWISNQARIPKPNWKFFKH